MSTYWDPDDDKPGPEKFSGESHTSGMAVASLILGLLSFGVSLFAAIPAVILGALSLGAINQSGGRVRGRGMAVTGIITGCFGFLILPALLLLPAVQAAREAAHRAQCSNNLKQIALAIHNYYVTNNCYPPASLPDENGKPRCSWRVSILPFVEQVSVYNAYNFSVAWDHPVNTTAINTRIDLYTCPSERIAPGEELFTNYLMVTGPGTFYDPEHSLITRPQAIGDGLASTIGVVQSSRKVHWASPDDLVLDMHNLNQPLPLDLLRNPHPGGFQALFLDGSIRFVKFSTPPQVLRALFSAHGGEQIPLNSSY